MAEIDIDKILEHDEAKQKNKANFSKLKWVFIGAGILAVIVIIAVLEVSVIMGEKSSTYFPLEKSWKMLYNRSNMSPEEWQTLDKKEVIGGYTCVVLNKIDKGNYATRQEYYSTGKGGIVRMGVSENFSGVQQTMFGMLPFRIKEGKEFSCGTVGDLVLKGKVLKKVKMNTPSGLSDAFEIVYTGAPYVDMTVWYAKETGIVKQVDRLTGIELLLISKE